MESEQVIVAELREIQAELRHLSKQWGDTFAVLHQALTTKLFVGKTTAQCTIR